MKLVIIEPLGVNDEKLLSMAKDMLPADLEIVYYNTRVTDTETLIERGHDADIIAVSNLPMNADVINGCKNLKMLSVAFTGVDHIAMDACKANGVLVSNCAGYSTAAVADLVFGMIIALYRNMIPCNDVVRKEGTSAPPPSQTPSAARSWRTAARKRRSPGSPMWIWIRSSLPVISFPSTLL